jgi:hypothetical protein
MPHDLDRAGRGAVAIGLMPGSGRSAPSEWREAVGIFGTIGNPGWRALPRKRAWGSAPRVSGGVRDPVAVELQQIVRRAH